MANEQTTEQRVTAAFNRAKAEWEALKNAEQSPAYFLQIFTQEGDGCFDNAAEIEMCYKELEALVSKQKHWSEQERATVIKSYKEAILPELRRTYMPYTVNAFFDEVMSYNPQDEFRPRDMEHIAFQKGTFNIIGARPGSGKTTLAISLAMKAIEEWREDSRVIFLTYEESPKRIYTRIFNRLLFAEAREAGELEAIKSDNPRQQLFFAIKGTGKQEITERVRRIARHVNELEKSGRLEVIDFAGKEVSAIESLLKFHEGALVFIDYVQLVRPAAVFQGNELAGLNDISIRLTDCAKDNNAIIIAAAQLKRAGGKDAGDSDKPSQLTVDRLKDCGHFEQDANTIIELGKNTDWKDAKREEHDSGEPLYFWKLVKNRDGGGVNSCYLFNTAGGAMGFSYMASTRESADFLEREPKETKATQQKKKIPNINDDKPPTADDMLRSMQW